jgi:hypothetical protein
MKNSNKKELKFIHITKNSGTYIENIALENNIRFGRFHNEYGKEHHRLFNEIDDNIKNKYDWFMVVRNPYDRILSEYYCPWGGIGKKNITHTKEEFNEYLIDKINNRNKLNRPGIYHYIEQYKYFDNKYVIHIIKYENLNKELNKLFKKYDLNIKLNQEKVNSREKNNNILNFKISDFNDNLINLINNIYHKDFILFNYNKILVNL